MFVYSEILYWLSERYSGCSNHLINDLKIQSRPEIDEVFNWGSDAAYGTVSSSTKWVEYIGPN